MAVRGDKLVNHIINDDTSLNLFNFVNTQIMTGIRNLNALELWRRENYNLVLFGEVYKNMNPIMCQKLTSLLSDFYNETSSNAYMYRCFVESKIYVDGNTIFGFSRKTYSDDDIFSSEVLIVDFITSYKCLYKLLYLDNYEQNLAYRVNNIRNGIILNNIVGYEEIGLPERDAYFFKEKGFYDLGDLMPAVLRYLNNDWKSYSNVFDRVIPKLKSIGVLHPICYTKSRVGNILKLNYPFNIVAYASGDVLFAINLYNQLESLGYLSTYNDLVTKNLNGMNRCDGDSEWLLGYFRDGYKVKDLYLKPAKRLWYDYLSNTNRHLSDFDSYNMNASLDWRLHFYFKHSSGANKLYTDGNYIVNCIEKELNN